MKKSLALKSLLRSPLKTLVTFLLIAAASFALFSRVTDYAVTTRETAQAARIFTGVAALDNTMPRMMMDLSISTGLGVGSFYQPEAKPWPTDEQIAEFSSLPGVTLTDIRYMTAGQVGDYDRLIDPDFSDFSMFAIEGDYNGYEEDSSGQFINLKFDNVKVLAYSGNEIKLSSEEPLIIKAIAIDVIDVLGSENPYSRAFFDTLKTGTRCFVHGSYNGWLGSDLQLEWDSDDTSGRFFHVLDGLGDDYLETEEFAEQKGWVDALNQNRKIYDIVYTSDMRAIPRINEHKMTVTKGRPLTSGETGVCVVSETFLETNGLSVGDNINITLGDKLLRQSASNGAQAWEGESISNFGDSAELEIIGAYQFVDTETDRRSETEWSYTINTIFVPSSILPVEVPADREPYIGEFSVFIEDANDIEKFLAASEPLISEMDVNMRFSDGGWMSMKDSFETGSLISFLTTLLYAAGAALAMFLAVYLYVGRNKKSYAIMRTLGVPGNKAQNSIVLPLIVLSIFAIPAGGVAGLFQASNTAAKALADMAESAPYGYVPDTALPLRVILLCLLGELAFTTLITLLFLQNMKRIPPLELLQGSILRAGAAKKAATEMAGSYTPPARLEIAKLPTAGEKQICSRRKYRATRHVFAYVLRHMKRGAAKALTSLVLAATLTAGIGSFVMAQLTFKDAFQNLNVTCKAFGFSDSSMTELLNSDLTKDLYYHGSFDVYINGLEHSGFITFTNDLERYTLDNGGNYSITYADGYDSSFLEGSAPLCLMGKSAAEQAGVQAGDEISLLSSVSYNFLNENYKDDEAQFQMMLGNANKPYTVVGIIDSGNAEIDSALFAAPNFAAESLYTNPFMINHCEFSLADNEKLEELHSMMEELKAADFYNQSASFYIDSNGLKNLARICDLLKQLFPIAVAAAVLIGIFGAGLVIMQSAQEAAFLRVLGVTKIRTRCMLVLEQVLLCIIAIAIVTGALVLYSPELFVRSLQTLSRCETLYLLGNVCGAAVASVLITRHKILDLLHVKE